MGLERVALIDSQPLFLDALSQFVAQSWPHARICAAPTFETARPVLEGGCDIVVYELSCVEGAAIDALDRLVQSAREALVIVRANDLSPTIVQQALALGVRGYLPNTMSAATVRDALSVVLAGGLCVPSGAWTAQPMVASRWRIQPLREPEIRVLARLERGDSNKMIARELGMSLAAVKLCVSTILRAADARNRAEAIGKANLLRAASNVGEPST